MIMIKKLVFILLMLTFSVMQAQSFDKSLEKMAEEMAVKLNRTNNLKFAVYPFYDKVNKHSDLSRLMSDDFSVYLDQKSINYSIMERNLLEQYMTEHQMNDEGLIDPATAKEFGMLIAVDAYITGKILIMSTYIRLHVFAINTQTGERIYSGFKKIPLDQDIAEFVGIHDLKEKQEKANMHVSSNADCAEQNVGDYCFVNRGTKPIFILLTNTGMMLTFSRRLTVAPNDKGCFKNLPAGKSYYYQVSDNRVVISKVLYEGDIQVNVCKSDYKTIR